MNSFKVTLVSIFFVLKSVDHQHGNSTTKIKQEKFETYQDRKICDDANEMNDDAYLFWQTHALIIRSLEFHFCV